MFTTQIDFEDYIFKIEGINAMSLDGSVECAKEDNGLYITKIFLTVDGENYAEVEKGTMLWNAMHDELLNDSEINAIFWTEYDARFEY